MARYRSKPSEITAEQFTIENQNVQGVIRDDSNEPYVETIHGQLVYISYGDFVIREPNDVNYYPCKPDIFNAKYEKISD